MEDFKLGLVEAKFADIVWEHEPVSTAERVRLCAEGLNWKRTTTYTVLKRLQQRGIFKTENSVVSSVISREEFYSRQSRRVVEDSFDGSLPSFIAAFTSGKKLSQKEIDEIKAIIDEAGKEDPHAADIS